MGLRLSPASNFCTECLCLRQSAVVNGYFAFRMSHYAIHVRDIFPYFSFSSGTGDMSPDDPEEHVPTVQDSEINLLKSGDVT